MLDQMFTAESFRRIYDSENRKGFNVAGHFFPDLDFHTARVRESTQEIKELRRRKGSLRQADFDNQLKLLKQELSERKQEKSTAIDEELEEISRNIHEPHFGLSLTKSQGPKGKAIFRIDGSAETFFVVKQLQRTINRIYGVKPANRHDIVCQLRDALSCDFPYDLVRTDISSFYETINRNKLLRELDADQLLSSSSKLFIRQALRSYAELTSEPAGIPRGVGISAYLAELYLRELDKQIRSIDGLVLYCRYVDDIIAIFARPPSADANLSYKDLMLRSLTSLGLEHNREKTFEYRVDRSTKISFDYLGYNFVTQFGICRISLSDSKLKKYLARIDASFDRYNIEYPVRSRKAYRDLVSRVKFLTGNMNLTNSKSSARTGIYYNNSAATDLSCLVALDKRLRDRTKLVKRPSLRTSLKRFNFSDGFNQRRFHRFDTKTLRRIVKAWKYAT